MRRPLIQRPRRSSAYRTEERGVTLALVALAMVGIIAMAALSVDVGTLYQASAEAQRAADAAALAGAKILSFSGMTGDPTNSSGQWSAACAAASQIAQTVASQNKVGGRAPLNVTVTFLSSDSSNCNNSTGAFGVNPMVKVQVAQPNLATYFSRIWGNTGSSVSATATAEVFNPSNSSAYTPSGQVVPVQPRCVKPLIVPNVDPASFPGCTSGAGNCQPFVDTVRGTIIRPGIQVGGGGSGVIGEQFNIVPDCSTNGPACNQIPSGTLVYTPSPGVPVGGNLQYVPGLVSASTTAVPSCASGAFQQALAGCDQTTKYQCGVQSSSTFTPNQVDLNENPISTSDASLGVQCLTQQSGPGPTGQDTLLPTSYPYQIMAGSRNPLGLSGSMITNSSSIVTIPIYDGTLPLPGGNQQPPVTIVGFLQVFINDVNAGGINGSLNVTVLNVAGCGSGVPISSTPLYGTSPVPVRLITSP